MMNKILLLLFSPLIINAQMAFISGNEFLCDNSQSEAEVEVSFSNGIAPYSFIYAINGVNQGSTSTNDNPHFIRTKQEGIYTLTYFSDINNSGSINGSALVTISESPYAIFSTDSDTMSTLYSTLKLQDNSLGNIVSWHWNFGDGIDSYDQNPYHSYDAQIGIYQISLITTDNVGCSDTTFKNIWISDYHIMFIPNAFSPDYDGVNDLFCIEFNGIRESTFLFKVFDPNSNIVFQSNNPNDLRCSVNGEGWNGSNYLTGENLRVIDPVTEKSYVYSLYYQDFEGWKYQKFGKITLIR